MRTPGVAENQESIVLSGGPTGLPRIHRLDADVVGEVEKLAIDFYGRHQHFERTETTELVEGQPVPVFQWVYSTAVAE